MKIPNNYRQNDPWRIISCLGCCPSKRLTKQWPSFDIERSSKEFTQRTKNTSLDITEMCIDLFLSTRFNLTYDFHNIFARDVKV